MAGRYNRIKGKQYEKKIAKIIHNFLLENFEEYRNMIQQVGDNVGVKRDSTSGVSVDSKGDIELGFGVKFLPLAIECKKRNDLLIGIKNVFNLNKSKLKSIYEKQARRKAKQYEETKLYPVVVFAGNYTSDFVFFDIRDYETILDINSLYKFDLIKSQSYIVMKLSDFLRAVTWSYYKK